ncbi:MAG: hypothetical protein JXN59_07500, partial [Anaerolineae bacterium]|nr:hypothetical protein [Anaerolineae bacterium]
MQKTLAIALTDLRIFVSDRTNVIMATVLPILMTVLLGGAFNPSAPAWVRFDILDQDGSPQAAALITALREENSALLLCPVDHREDASCMLPEEGALTREAMITRVTEGITAGMLVIPAGYGEAVERLEPASLTYYSIANLTTGDAVLQSVEAVLQEINGSVVAARVAAGMAERLTGPGEGGSIFS